MNLILLVFLLAGQDSEIRNWNSVFLAGAGPFRPGSQVSTILGRESLTLRAAKSGRAFEIPITSITRVAFDSRTRRPATDALGGILKGGLEDGVGGDPQGAAAFVLVLPILMAVTSPLKRTDNLIYVQWREPGADSEVLLRLDKKDLASFLNALREATGKPWVKAQPRGKKG